MGHGRGEPPVCPLIGMRGVQRPRPPGQICRHLNDDKSDNTPRNLTWGTYLDNFFDAKRNGRLKCKRCFDLNEAARLRSLRLSVREIGYWLHVSQAAIAFAPKYGEHEPYEKVQI